MRENKLSFMLSYPLLIVMFTYIHTYIYTHNVTLKTSSLLKLNNRETNSETEHKLRDSV